MQILVVDDHPLILEALHQLLRGLEADVAVFDATSADGGRALAAAHPDADLMLLDLSLPGANGFALLEEMRASHPGIPVVVVSASDRRDDVLRALDLGAMGFIPKSVSSVVMLSALRLVLSGGVYLPPSAINEEAAPAAAEPRHAWPAPATPRKHPRDIGLTDRQAQVLALLLQGKPNKIICRELDLAEGTVKIHVAAILRALNVSSRTQAVIEASRIGLQLDGVLPPQRAV
jgi:DNA-binding NarL/FixJ family response regulator